MAGLLKSLEEKVNQKISERIGVLEPKLDEMNKHLCDIAKTLCNIELLLKKEKE